MTKEQVIARMWASLEGLSGDGVVMVMHREIGAFGDGFLIIDREVGRTFAVEVKEIKRQDSAHKEG